MENLMTNCVAPCRGLGSDIPVINEAIAAGASGYGTAPASTSSSWLQNLIGGAVGTVEDIFKAKNVVRGVLTQTSPGVFQYVQPTGSNVTLPISQSPVGSLTASGSSGMGMILLAGAGVFLVFMLAKGKN
jgi:hypothetical protein